MSPRARLIGDLIIGAIYVALISASIVFVIVVAGASN